MRCLFCGGEGGPDHLKTCDGQQGQVEAAEPTYAPVGHVRATDPDTSQEAADAIGSSAARQCKAVLALLRARGVRGLTTEQLVETHPGWRWNSISRRVTDLRQQGFVQDSGRRAVASTGRTVTIWVATEFL